MTRNVNMKKYNIQGQVLKKIQKVDLTIDLTIDILQQQQPKTVNKAPDLICAKI